MSSRVASGQLGATAITSTLVYVMERLLEAWEESETEDVTLVDNH